MQPFQHATRLAPRADAVRRSCSGRADALTHIPGPPPSDPELGNIGDFAKAGSLHQFLKLLAAEHGPVASFSWGTERVVSVAHPRGFLQVGKLHDRAGHLFAAFQPLIGANCLQYMNGALGKSRHRLMAKCFDRTAIADYLSDLRGVCMEANDSWQRRLEAGTPGPLELSAGEEGMTVGLRGIMAAAFGVTSEAERDAVQRAYGICWSDMEQRLITGSQPEPGSERQRRFDDSLAVLHDFARSRLGAGDRFLSKASESGLYPEQSHLLDDAVIAMVGGFHTTGTMLTWALYFLAKHTAVQDALAAECAAAGPVVDVAAALDDSTMLSRVINETLRCGVVAPWAARLVGDQPLEVLGHTLPPRTSVVLALGVTQEDPAIWPSPSDFDPDRFRVEAVRERKKEWGPLVFAPFGFAGGRVCPGNRLTMVEGALFLQDMLPRFRLTLKDPEQDPGMEYGLVTHPREDVRILVSPRAA